MAVPAPRLPRPASLAALLALALGAACGQNESCAFHPSGCQGIQGACSGAGGPLGAEGALPFDGQLILDGPPKITEHFPRSNTTVASTTPIVLVFSEAISADSLDGAISISGSGDQFGTGFGADIIASAHLLGDGRVLVLLPAASLSAGESFEIGLAPDASIRDLTGQALAHAPGTLLGTFAVAASDPSEPRPVTVFPGDDSEDQPTTSQLVVVFDREVDVTTVTPSSFVVTVDGAPAPFPPLPQPLTLAATILLPPTVDTRVYTAEMLDLTGELVPYATAAEVQLELSPSGSAIEVSGGEALDTTTSSFQTLAFDPPDAVAVTSSPSDAIGIPNVTVGSPTELEVTVTLTGAEEGDRVSLLLFGENACVEGELVALQRTEAVDPDELGVVVFDQFELDLVLETDPLALRFLDGEVALAVRLERDNAVSAVRVLDADPDAEGIQDILLDTVPPELLDLAVPGGGGDLYLSDVRDLVVAGQASEELGAVEVTTPLGDNGVQPSPLASDGSGIFLAVPVPLGVLGPGEVPLQYTVTLFDRALNASATPIEGLFTQVGQVGPNALAPGEAILVRVFDALTLEAVEGAVVATHADDVGFPLVDSDFTDLDGDAVVDAAGAAAAGTLLTVVADGFDAFTFHGLAADRIEVPLSPASPSTATVQGSFTVPSSLTSDESDIRLGDTRHDPDGILLQPPGCTPSFLGDVECAYGPETIRAGRLGAQALLGGDLGLDDFDPVKVLTLFELRVPALPAAPGSAEVSDFDLELPLNDPSVPPEEVPREIPQTTTTLDINLTTGIDLADLQDDPDTTGIPFVTVEADVPGLARSVLVGLGNTFDAGGGKALVRAAIPGAVDVGGALAESGLVDPDLHLRVELRDNAGNRVGKRPRLSRLDSLPEANLLSPGSVPALVDPAPGGAVAGPSYSLSFTNTLIDFAGEGGLYHVTLTDGAGGRWHLWVPDPPDLAGDVLVHLPDLSALGEGGLAAGSIQFEVDLVAFLGLDPGDMLWTDLAREAETYAFGAPETFTQD